MNRIVFLLVLLVCCSFATRAQAQALQSFPGDVHNRGETRILFWNGDARKSVGEVAISYGRPEWKTDYDKPGALDQLTKGKIWRAGNNFWTFLDTNVPLKIGGQDVAIGMYYLAVTRSEDGSAWSLAFIDPAETRSRLLDAFEVTTRPDEVPIVFKAPLTFKTHAETTKYIEMSLTGYPSDITKATLLIKWGSFELSAPVEAMLGN